MSIHVTRAPTVPLTSYDTKRRSHLNRWRACKGFSNRDITILSMNKTQKYLRY